MVSYLSYAFALGLVAAVNPCGFPMLPAYVSVFVGTENDRVPLASRLVRAVRSAAAVSLGFVILFAVLGAIFDSGLKLFMNWVPWVMVVLGAVMVAAGIFGTVRGHLPLRLPWVARARAGTDTLSMITFGMSYGLASLTCSLGLFVAGTAGTFTRVGWLTGLGTFIAYAVGMGAVLAVVAVASALARTSVVTVLRRAGRHVDRLASALLVVVGAYLIYYWVVDLTGQGTPNLVAKVEQFQGALVTWLSSHQDAMALAAIVVVVGTVCLIAFRKTNHKGRAV